jgi:hypothetical protein
LTLKTPQTGLQIEMFFSCSFSSSPNYSVDLIQISIVVSTLVYIVKNNKIQLKMKKINPFLFVAILLSPFSLSAQTFPLLNNAYSLNCSDITARTTTYWQKNSDGEIIKYLVQLKENNLSVAKGTVKKYGVDGNKILSEIVDGPNQNLTLETLELKPDGKGIRIFNYSSGGEVLVKNGKLASDETREMGYQSLCEPNSAVAVYMKTQFQTLVIKPEAPAPKKLPPDTSVNSQQSGSEGTVEALCAAVMYFAIGESTGPTKERYIKIGRAYLIAGAKLAGENKFVDMYERNKKIVNSFTDKDIKSLTNSCIKMAPK